MRFQEVGTPIALIVLALGAAGYAYFVDRTSVSDADRAERRRDVFPSFRVEDVTRVKLTGNDGVLTLERAASTGAGERPWMIATPARGAADAGAVDTLLRELELATRVRDVEGGAATGLSQPRIRGVIDVGALVYRFALGDDAPRPEGAAYMSIEGEGTFVVGSTLRTQLLRGYDAYRPRSVVDYGESEIARVEVTTPDGEGFALDRKDGSFRLSGDGLRASRAAVERLFTALAEARADVFLDDAAAEQALTDGATHLVLVPRDPGRPHVDVRFGGRCPGQPEDTVVARSAPTRMSACVAKAAADAFATKRSAIVDASPFYARADEIEDLRLESQDGRTRVDLARHGTGWHERAPEERDLDSEESDSANILAAALAGARGNEILPSGVSTPDGPFVPRSRATVVRTGSEATEVVELGAPSAIGGATWARRLDDGAMLRLPLEAARRLQAHPAALRTRVLFPSQPDPADVTAIDSTCGPSPEKLERQADGWGMKAPIGFAADPLATADLVSALVHARADEVLADADDGTFGLTDGAACRVTLTAKGNGETGAAALTLTFGGASDHGFYARTSEDPAVIAVPRILRALATHPMIERKRFAVDDATVTALAAIRDGKMTPLDLAADAGIHARAAAASFVVEAALHTGRAEPTEGFSHPAAEIDVTMRGASGPPVVTHLVFGNRTTVDGVEGYFARAVGLDATFVVMRPGVDALIAAIRNDTPNAEASDSGPR